MVDEFFLWEISEGKMSSYINIGCWLQESATSLLCHGQISLHHIDLSLEGNKRQQEPRVRGTHSTLLVSRQAVSYMLTGTCIVKAPNLLGQTWYFAPRSRHNTIVTRVLKYPWTTGSFSQGAGIFAGDAVYRDKHSVILMG